MILRLGVAVEQASYFETFIEEFSKIEFFADNDLSGNFTIGLTPKTFESGDINQIKSVETTNFDIFVAPTVPMLQLSMVYRRAHHKMQGMEQLLLQFLGL